MPKPLKKNLIYNTGGYGYTLTRLQEVKKTSNVDVLFLGSSHTYRSFDNRIFKKNSITSFNLGSNAQSALQTNLLLKRYLKQLKPSLVVYEVYPGNLSNDGVESSLNIISNDDIDVEALNMVFKQNHLKVYNSFIYGFFKDAIKNKSTIKENLNRFDDRYVRGGYVEKKIKHYNKLKHSPSDWKINQSQLNSYDVWAILYKHTHLLKYIDPSKLNTHSISNVIVKHPHLIKDIDPSKLDEHDIVLILRNQPDLINYFDLSKLDGHSIKAILIDQPSLIKHFDLSKLDGYNIKRILSNQPSLIKHFDLSKLNPYNISDILSNQPSLIKHFDLSKLKGYDIEYMFDIQPQLKKYFK
jgi:hypothetical protein